MYNKEIAIYAQPVLIFNPRAGRLSRDRSRLLQRSIATLAEAGLHPELLPTTGPESATALARRAVEAGADLILVAGGDGTVNEVVNGIAHTEVPLGVLPGGTANVLCMEMRAGGKMVRVAQSIRSYVPERIALGRLNWPGGESRYFLLMAGAGLDAQIVADVNPWLKAKSGKFAYWAGGFSQVFQRIEEFEVEVNGRTYPASFALTTRVRNYGGDLEIARNVSLLEPDFEVVLCRGNTVFRYLSYLGGILAGQIAAIPGVTVLRATHLSIHCGAASLVRLQVDGELAHPAPVEIEIVPSALTLLMPPDLRERLGIRSGITPAVPDPVPLVLREAHPDPGNHS
jgi:diacylglycerol kinase family enzyme